MKDKLKQIKEVLRQAVLVCEYRSGDIDTEDGSFASTDIESIINLEAALADYLDMDTDTVLSIDAMPIIDTLEPKPVDHKETRSQLHSETLVVRNTETGAEQIMLDRVAALPLEDQVTFWRERDQCKPADNHKYVIDIVQDALNKSVADIPECSPNKKEYFKAGVIYMSGSIVTISKEVKALLSASKGVSDKRIQAQYDGFENKVQAINPFIDDLLAICEKHGIDIDDLNFVNGLFQSGYMPPLTTNKEQGDV